MPTKFDFVSPGIELREIDQSQVAPVPEADGLLLIGRSRKGPAMKPVKVTSLENFIEVFGAPMDGVKASDPWRQGNTSAASYAGYAAQAYLASGVGPVKFIRLGGLHNDTEKAGWKVNQGTLKSGILDAEHSGAFGLFVAPSGAAGESLTGTLAAVFYSNQNQFGLSGKVYADNTTVEASASTFIVGSGGQFTLNISSSDGDQDYTFNFNKNSPNFIRNMFNTDPTQYDAGSPSYFLGETFESQVNDLSASTDNIGFIAALSKAGEASNSDWVTFESELKNSKTGWFTGVAPLNKKLFRIAAIDDGAQFQREYYIVIKDLSEASVSKKDATFTIEVRKYSNPSTYVEKFSGLTLNPDSPNFIAKKIGDFHQFWEEGTGGNSGKFTVDIKKMNPNNSNLIRVELAESSTLSPSDLPVGFVGPLKKDDIIFDHTSSVDATGSIYGKNFVPNGNTSLLVSGSASGNNYKFVDPTHLLTTTGTYLGTRDYPAGQIHGLRFKVSNGLDETIGDVGLLRSAESFEMHLDETADVDTASYFFSLELMQSSSTSTTSFYFDADQTGSNIGTISDIIKKGIKQFAAPFFGGFDGVNQLLNNPFNETRLSENKYERHSIFQTLEMIQDRDIIRYDLVSIPGVTNQRIVGDLLRQTEDRGDALAIVDLEGIYQSNADNGNSNGLDTDLDLDDVISTMNEMALNTSYGATYYPNIRLRDTLNGNGTVLMAPPSVAAIGAIAKSEGDSQPWFAPAGFNRGGLNPLGGNKGPVVLGSAEHLTKADRDKLYEVNINPIARFPATGDTVVFGQKTLQQDASALDRINVRRLMNYLKREIGDIADTILFDQNVQATWNRFKTRAEAVLSQVRSDYGITEYKLVLDETTTTPDLQDRNILYAKVFVKPARAIEFIAVDFVITQSGVEF